MATIIQLPISFEFRASQVLWAEKTSSASLRRLFIQNPKAHIEEGELRKHSRPADAWQMREELLRMKPDPDSAKSFLNKWGRWRPFPRNYIDLDEIFDLQRVVRHALTSSPKRWFASTYAFPTMISSRSTKFPYFVMLTDACQVAIRMTITIDLLRELEFKTCARPDCGLPFEVKSRHKRKFCSWYCGHLESVRRSQRTITTKRTGA
jgi:hypothetical protein